MGIHTADPAWYEMLKKFAEENRKNSTKAESILWQALKNKGIEYKFRRQHIIRDFIVDFYCTECQLSIELDGDYHQIPEQLVSDEQRTVELTQMGIMEIRFTNEEIINNLDEVLKKIQEACFSRKSPLLQEGKGEANLSKASYTLRYLLGEERIPVPTSRRPWNLHIDVKGARHNNLKGIDVTFPLNVLTVVTGVSGSGKSSLVRDIFYKALNRQFGESGDRPGDFTRLEGDIRSISAVEFVDQNPIGRSTRSNPVTYIKAYDEIRKLYAAQPLSKQMGYTAGYFSFNSEGGRCEECKGEGTITVEMQFMSDLVLECEACHGKRFKNDTLLVKYHDRDIHDILEMTVNQAIEFFAEHGDKTIVSRLRPLQAVGLGYIKLGQSSSTLSGGENQRVKLAYYLGQERSAPTLFIFDEPTTGLHFHDIKKLFESFNALIDRGHTILIIEHNMEVIKCADYVIDLGPEGGDAGGNLVVCGTPEQVAACPASYTGRFLREKLA
ncbi:MAG: DUF559 domain-containing protein [Bacteroidaceae bacterium]|nr:DUF559 domain-containing protein [Bacteroidaceae bacterium]